MPLKKRRSIPPAARSANQQQRRKPAALTKEREDLLQRMKVLQQQAEPPRSIETAQALLTRWWAHATWQKRERLIKAAEWIVRVESKLGTNSPARA